MESITMKKRVLSVAALAGVFLLGACAEEDTPPSGLNDGQVMTDTGPEDGIDAGMGDVEDPPDVEPELDAGGEEDASGGDDVGGDDVSEDICDLEGFRALDGLEMEQVAGGWSLFADADSQVLSLNLSSADGEVEPGVIEFKDVALAEQANSLLMASGCTPVGCESTFMAVAGSLEVKTFEGTEGGIFEGTLSDVELVEIVDGDRGYERVEGGLSWCVASLDLSATSVLRDSFPESVECDRESFAASAASAGTVDARILGEDLVVEASTAAQPPQDLLSLQVYPSLAGAATDVGTYTLDDFNYASCSTCLLVYAECTDRGCAKTFIAGRGELEIIKSGRVNGDYVAGELFSAKLRRAQLVEVTIDPGTYETALVEGGQSWCIDEFVWDTTLRDPAAR